MLSPFLNVTFFLKKLTTLEIIMTSGGVCVERERWYDLGYFKYEIIHKKWQYHLFTWLKGYFASSEINRLVNTLWKKYPKGLVANVSKGNVPDACRGFSQICSLSSDSS